MKYHKVLNFRASGTWILKIKDKIRFCYSRNVVEIHARWIIAQVGVKCRC
jgi:hypothetical protein